MQSRSLWQKYGLPLAAAASLALNGCTYRHIEVKNPTSIIDTYDKKEVFVAPAGSRRRLGLVKTEYGTVVVYQVRHNFSRSTIVPGVYVRDLPPERHRRRIEVRPVPENNKMREFISQRILRHGYGSSITFWSPPARP